MASLGVNRSLQRRVYSNITSFAEIGPRWFRVPDANLERSLALRGSKILLFVIALAEC